MNDSAPSTAPARPTARTLADLAPLGAAEEKIVAALASGDFDRLGDGLRPEQADPARTVRAELLRFRILGREDGPCPHEKGMRLSGARITGMLDLEGCRIPHDIGLKDCHFEAVPVLRSAVIDSLFLDGSTLPGLQADRLEARAGVHLRGAMVSGEVRLRDARLGGPVECDGATVDWPDDIALNAGGLEARGGCCFAARSCAGASTCPPPASAASSTVPARRSGSPAARPWRSTVPSSTTPSSCGRTRPSAVSSTSPRAPSAPSTTSLILAVDGRSAAQPLPLWRLHRRPGRRGEPARLAGAPDSRALG